MKNEIILLDVILLFENNIPLTCIGGEAMATEESTLQISGMTCTTCAASIEKGISKIDGVEQANVNFALELLQLCMTRRKQM